MFAREAVAFFAALGFFTRLPVPSWAVRSTEGLDRASRYLPLVGILVGAIGAAATWLSAFALPMSVAVLIGMAMTILATGAFHEDGLADSIDGFGGGWTKEQVLEIMKDPRTGSYGAIGVSLALLIKWNALMEVDPVWLPFALVAGHAVSRLAAVALMASLDYARADETSRARPVAARMGAGAFGFAALFGLAPCLLLPPREAAMGVALAPLSTLLAARYFIRRIGGYTGDCLGATQQLAELAFYLGLLCDFSS